MTPTQSATIAALRNPCYSRKLTRRALRENLGVAGMRFAYELRRRKLRTNHRPVNPAVAPVVVARQAHEKPQNILSRAAGAVRSFFRRKV